MGKLIIMNVTLALLAETSIRSLMSRSEMKALEDSFYLVINEEVEQ